MEPKELVERVLSVDENIRYVGVVGREYELLESRVRKGVKSLTEGKEREEFVEIVPAVILGAAEKLEKALGPISYSVIRYKKATLVFFRYRTIW